MAGGPILPFSCEPITAGNVFPTRLTAEMPRSLGVIASLSADSIWRLFYKMPPSIPAGTFKMSLMCQANATSGNAKPNVKWKSYAATELPAASGLNAIGVGTITFATTAYRLTELVVTMTGDTPVANEILMVDLTLETSGWTLAATLGILPPSVYWE